MTPAPLAVTLIHHGNSGRPGRTPNALEGISLRAISAERVVAGWLEFAEADELRTEER
jgi:hypothetical protein